MSTFLFRIFVPSFIEYLPVPICYIRPSINLPYQISYLVYQMSYLVYQISYLVYVYQTSYLVYRISHLVYWTSHSAFVFSSYILPFSIDQLQHFERLSHGILFLPSKCRSYCTNHSTPGGQVNDIHGLLMRFKINVHAATCLYASLYF